jgi:aminoglycoside phosphotransferase (APT) family kinase protein
MSTEARLLKGLLGTSSLNRWGRRAAIDSAPLVFERVVRAQGGASSETYFVTARSGARAEAAEWVLRVEPTDHQVYQEPSIARQFAIISRLAREPGLPIPRPIALETDASVIGAPFFLMERASGDAPPNDYHSEGVLAGLDPARRLELWRESIALLARLHAVDPTDFGFLAFRGFPPDADGVAQELARWESYRAWCGVPDLQVYDRALRWLHGVRPVRGTNGFAWGDARLPNIMFAKGRPTALLDWETASLGGAETDLGWWLFYDRMVAEAAAIPRLAGIGDAAATVALWESYSARRALDMDWHQVFAGYRFALISERARSLAIAGGRLPADQWGPANPAICLLERMLDEHGG